MSTVRILLLGEQNVGKTTLVLSLVSEEFSPKVPAQADEITIPADVTPERVPTEIVDFSSRVQTQDQLLHEIRNAMVVCLVYALDNDTSMSRIAEYWLPLIRSCADPEESRIPIVLVGNKLDLVPGSKMEQVLHLMEQFPEIETCIECSAKTMRNLSETFWFAQKAVLYPTLPLYSAKTKELTVDCVRALTRIFRICDIDNDGYLCDKELEAFQERCFSIPLTAQSLDDVKQLIRTSAPGGITLNGVTLKGFLFLHLVFVRKGRHETTWTVLRQFGYDNHLRLSYDFLHPKFSVPPGSSTELSPLGLSFLHTLFTKYDLDRDECLSPSEMSELLATFPEDAQLIASDVGELGISVETNSIGWISRRGFLAHWILVAMLHPSRCLTYMAYLGFTYQTGYCYLSGDVNKDLVGLPANVSDDKISSSTGSAPLNRNLHSEADFLLRALTVSSDRRLDYIRRSTNRTVFHCRVYGARKVGKTCLCQGLLGRSIRGDGGFGIGGVSSRTSNWTCATGIPVYGQSRTLIMHEINSAHGEQMSAEDALSADVACLVYDVTDPNSFQYVVNIYLNFYRGTRVPCLFVAAKSDQPHVLQNFYLDPQELVTKYRLPDVIPFSSISIKPLVAVGTASSAGSGPPRKASVDSLSRPASSVYARSNWFLSDNEQTPDSDMDSAQNIKESPHKQVQTDILESTKPRCQSSTNVFGLLSSSANLHNTQQKKFQKDSVCEGCAAVYIKLATMANYPHMRGLELAPTDYAWKLTLVATVLAGFGFVAFRMAKPHF